MIFYPVSNESDLDTKILNPRIPDELETFRTEGVLINGEIRKLNTKFFDSKPTNLFVIGELVYHEIAKRHYKCLI